MHIPPELPINLITCIGFLQCRYNCYLLSQYAVVLSVIKQITVIDAQQQAAMHISKQLMHC